MAGLEVEHFAVAALEGDAAAEDVAAFEPADEDHLAGVRNVEALAVHLFVRQLEVFADALGDRVGRGDVPEPFLLARFAPLERAGAAGGRLEDLREVAGMQHDEPHPLLDPLQHLTDDVVAHLGVGAVAPPDQHVGGLDHLVGEPVLRFVERGEADGEVVRRDPFGDGGVKPVRIDRFDPFILLFVTEFIPDGDIDLAHRNPPDSC